MINKCLNILIIIFMFFILVSCASLFGSLATSLYQQKDIKLVEDGAPAYLLLVEALINNNTQDKALLRTGIQLFTAYSVAFVSDTDRKKIFNQKTKDLGLAILRTYPKFKDLEKKPFDIYKTWVNDLNKNDVGDVFWAADAWILWIISNTDSIEALMDLPKAKVIIDKIYSLDDSYYFGAPHLFYGLFYSLIPESIGGDKKKAKEEFDKALKYSDEKLLTTKVTYAEFYLKAIYDKENFKKVLNEVIKADVDAYPEIRLINLFAQKHAKEMLEKIDEFFYD